MPTMIDPLSATSIFIEIYQDNIPKAVATGFIVSSNNILYLITNKHVVTPSEFNATKLKIYYHGLTLGSWNPKFENLYDGENKKWLEHPSFPNFDVVALKIVNVDNTVKIYPFDLNLANTDMIPEPAMPVSIIGYPAGIRTGVGFPVWKTGHIASDPELNYDNKPIFLIDATTRGGMSGSPVVLRLTGGFRQNNGNRMIAMAGTSTKFLGVYSGRIMLSDGSSEIGFV
jgi:S1-C subfamily serine protease